MLATHLPPAVCTAWLLTSHGLDRSVAWGMGTPALEGVSVLPMPFPLSLLHAPH